MKLVPTAFDGKTFATAEECKAYEAQHVGAQLVGLTIEQVNAAISREDVELADAIEKVGARIAATRREGGDLRRQRKAPAAPAQKEAAE